MAAYKYRDAGERADALAGVTRVVVKVGTRLLTDVPGVSEGERVVQLIDAIAQLRNRSIEILVVSSGAIGAGMALLNTDRRPRSLPQLQALAAAGQSRLMYLYETACQSRGFHCAQLLLTAADLQDRDRHLNAKQCLDALLSRGVLPIINENDSVSVEEIRFGDNDILAGLVATMARAELTVLLTTVNGLRERAGTELGRRVAIVSQLTHELRSLAGDTDDTRLSVGGMASKLRAAEQVTRAGEALWVVDGSDFGVLNGVFAGADVGTLFLPTSTTRMRGHKRYLAFFSEPAGDVVVDAGAERALVEDGRSLLPIGIVSVNGQFSRGDTVRIRNCTGDEIGRGIVNYSSTETERIRGCRSREIPKVLGYCAYDEVVHRDYLVATGKHRDEKHT